MEVMFDMTDKFGTIKSALEILEKGNRESFDALKWFVIHMANDGELCRRESGYDHLVMVKESDISLRMKPIEYEEFLVAVVQAINLGYNREVKSSDDDIDLELAEINEKKTTTGD